MGIFKTYGLSEQWIFNNQFMQFVEPGKISLQDFKYNIIESIQFTETRDFGTDQHVKKAIIKMMDENDITRTYNCNYLDMVEIILLQIYKGSETIELILYIVRFAKDNVWYSFSISLDIENGFVRGINENNNRYINYIGIVKRNI